MFSFHRANMKFLLALSICLLASCAGLSSGSSNALVGEWRYADKIQSCHYVFEGNGTFRGEVIYRKELLSKFTGTWSVKGDALHYRYTRDVLGRIQPGALDRDKLLEVEKDFFVIQAADGSKRRYDRVTPRPTEERPSGRAPGSGPV